MAYAQATNKAVQTNNDGLEDDDSVGTVNKMEYTYHYSSPLGGITLAGCEDAITGLWFDGQKYFGKSLCGQHEESYIPIFGEAIRWLDIYFSCCEPDFTPNLKITGTPFRQKVWDILLTIPYGRTMTYGDIAAILAEQRGISRMSAQAVGGAVGHNPISLIIPCHRVVGSNGALTGYAGGIDRKLSLLRLEKAIAVSDCGFGSSTVT